MVIYTSGRGLNVARLDDGQLIASYQPESKAHPTAVAMHPYEVCFLFFSPLNESHLSVYSLYSFTS